MQLLAEVASRPIALRDWYYSTSGVETPTLFPNITSVVPSSASPELQMQLHNSSLVDFKKTRLLLEGSRLCKPCVDFVQNVLSHHLLVLKPVQSLHHPHSQRAWSMAHHPDLEFLESCGRSGCLLCRFLTEHLYEGFRHDSKYEINIDTNLATFFIYTSKGRASKMLCLYKGLYSTGALRYADIHQLRRHAMEYHWVFGFSPNAERVTNGIRSLPITQEREMHRFGLQMAAVLPDPA